MSSRHRIYLPALVALVAVLHGYLYLAGFRLTADDVKYHLNAMNGLAASWDAAKNAAFFEGRIGHFLDLPLAHLAAGLADHLPFRVFYVTLFFANFALAAVYVNALSRSHAGWFLLAVLLALHTLDYFHLSPNAFPLWFSVAAFLFLSARISLLRIRGRTDGSRGRLEEYLWLAVCFLAMLYSELVFAFALSLILVEFAARFLSSASSGRGWLSALTHAGRQRSSRIDLALIGLFALVYLGFRTIYPSGYEGNQPLGIMQPLMIMKTMLGHVLGASVFSAMARADTAYLGFLREMEPADFAQLIAFFMAVFLASILALNHTLADDELADKPFRAWSLAALALIAALVVTAPFAVTAKYQGWCHSLGTCVYLSSSLAYLGFGVSMGFALLGITAFLSRRFASKRIAVYCVSAALAGAAMLSHAYNLRMEARMEQSAAAWERALTLTCTPPRFKDYVNPFLPRVIDPFAGVDMHPRFDALLYWRTYMAKNGHRARCDDPETSVAQLYPDIERGQTIGFSDIDITSPYLLDGWSRPEAWGRWSQAGRARMILPLGLAARDVTLDFKALVNEAHPAQEFVISANGVRLGEFSVSQPDGNRLSVRLPQRKPSGGYEDVFVVLEFELNTAVSPAQLGLGSDSRSLAIGLVSLTIR